MALIRPISSKGTSVNYALTSDNNYRYIVPSDGSNGIRISLSAGTATFDDVTFTSSSTGFQLNKPCTVYNVAASSGTGIVTVETYAANQSITISSGNYPVIIAID